MRLEARFIAPLLCAALLASCEPALDQADAPRADARGEVDADAERQRINELNQEWMAAIAAGDVDAIEALHTEGGRVMPPNAPWGEGRSAIGDTWRGMMELPGLQVAWEPTQIEISEAGDMAYDIGTYELSFDADGQRVEDRGKYLVVWEKVDGDWRVAADMFSSDLPAS